MSDVNVKRALPEIVTRFREQLQNSTYQFKDGLRLGAYLTLEIFIKTYCKGEKI